MDKQNKQSKQSSKRPKPGDKITVNLDARRFILLSLQAKAVNKDTPPEDKEDILALYEYLNNCLADVDIRINKGIGGVNVTYRIIKGKEEEEDKVIKILESNLHIREILRYIAKAYIPKETKKDLTKISVHTVRQFYGDAKQISLFSDEKIDAFRETTGLNLTNRPENYGVVLNQTQSRVFEGILKAFTDTNYKGSEQKEISKTLEEVYTLNDRSAKTLVKGESAPYKHIDTIPVVKLTQAEIIELSGYDLSKQRQGDKQDVMEALSFLSTNQFCFYWIRLKTDNDRPVRDKRGDYVKEEVMEVGTLLRIKTIRDQAGQLQYYEIHPSAVILDQVNSYFLLVPNNWREEVKQLTGNRASRYTYELLLWLRLQYEQIRRYNSTPPKGKKPLSLNKSWEEVAIALKMPESMYSKNRKRAYAIIQEAYSVAIKLGYLKKVETNGATDTLYLNEGCYPKPGELV